MASAELSRRVENVVGYPPLVEMDDRQRREFHEALLDADSFEDLPGKWQAVVVAAEQNRPKPVAIYTTTLSMPLLGESPDAILSWVCAALRGHPRVQAMRDELEHPDEDEATEHVSVEVRSSAESSQAALRIAYSPSRHRLSLR